MSFKEKSTWVMLIALLITAVPYLLNVVELSDGYQLPPPNLQDLLTFTMTLIVITVVGYIIISALSSKQANAKLDERERRIFDRAGKISGYVFGFGVVTSLLYYLAYSNGNLLFYGVLASLIISQLCEYMIQIYLFRWSVH